MGERRCTTCGSLSASCLETMVPFFWVLISRSLMYSSFHFMISSASCGHITVGPNSFQLSQKLFPGLQDCKLGPGPSKKGSRSNNFRRPKRSMSTGTSPTLESVAFPSLVSDLLHFLKHHREMDGA